MYCMVFVHAVNCSYSFGYLVYAVAVQYAFGRCDFWKLAYRLRYECWDISLLQLSKEFGKNVNICRGYGFGLIF